METTNPVLRSQAFQQARAFVDGAQMTLQGAVNKTLFLKK